MPLRGSLVFFFFLYTLYPIPNFCSFHSADLLSIYYVPATFTRQYIIAVKKRNKYYFPCRNYILNYFDIYLELVVYYLE